MLKNINHNGMNKKKRIIIYAGGGGSGGYIRYCKGLLKTRHLPESFKTYLVISPSFLNQLGQVNETLNVISHPWISSPSICKRIIWHCVLYPRLILRVKADIEFYVSGFLPPLRRLWKGGANIVTTCHNLLPFYLKNDLTTTLRTEYVSIAKLLRNHYNSLYNSDAIIFLSQHSKDLVSEAFGRLQLNTIVAHGLDKLFLREEPRNYEIGELVQILYVSPIYPYKHQAEVVLAITMLRTEMNLNIQLRLVGGGSPQAIGELRNYINSLDAGDFVSIVKFVNDEMLLEEYRQGDIFLFASSCETFGITIVEAMGQRLPIACSRESGLRDLLRDAGVYFDPTDTLSIVHALKQLLVDQSARKKLGEKAYKYSLDFTWEKCVTRTVEFLRGM